MSDDTPLRLASTALFIACGATDDELDDALTILERHIPPHAPSEIARQIRDVLAIVRINRAEQ